MKLSHHSWLWDLDQRTEEHFTIFPQHKNEQVHRKLTYVRYDGTLKESVISNIRYSRWYSHSKDSKQHKLLGTAGKWLGWGLITP